MKSIRFTFILSLLLISLSINNKVTGQSSGRKVQNFNFDWKFFKGDIPDGQNPALKDDNWRKLDLPHDWSIEGPFSKDFASGTGFLPAGIGWYRKSFIIPANEKNRKVFIYFDGVYNNSEVWINGNYLGKRPNGYISFQYDLTPYLKFGKENLIAVKVDHSKFGDSRWYTGSGIYRNVKLISVPQVHIKKWGVFASSINISEQKASLAIKVYVINESVNANEVFVTNFLISGTDTVMKKAEKLKVGSKSEGVIDQKMEINNPKIWDIYRTTLYLSLIHISEP